MKKWNAYIAWLLCLALLLTLPGCTQEPEPTEVDTQPTTEATEAPTEPPAEELYAQARAAVLAMEDIALEIETIETRTLGGQTYTTHTFQTILYQGLGTETMTASVEDRTLYGSNSLNSQLYYADGTGYTSMLNMNFCSSMTPDEFTECFLPAVLLDESLYSSITSESSGRGLKLTFSGADGLEPWLANEYAVPVEISGTADLDSQDCLSQTQYCATYTQGGMTVEVTATVTIAGQDTFPDLTETLEGLQADAIDIPHLSLPYLLYQSNRNIRDTESLTASTSATFISQAAGWATMDSTACDFCGEDDEFAYYIDCDNLFMNSEGSSDEYSYTESYIDCIQTYTPQSGEAESWRNGAYSYLKAWLLDDLTSHLPTPSMIETMDMEYTASNLIISYTLNEYGAQTFYSRICEGQFAEPDILDTLASDYHTDEMSGYLSIDLATGLPVVVASNFTGVHTIEGGEYILSEEFYQTLYLGSGTAYETIHGEPLPEEEPETKATPVFYHVTGDAGQEMWLLGTIHVGDARTAYLPQEIYNALNAADALAVEFDLTAFEENIETDEDLIAMVMENYYYTDGTTLADHIDPELYDQVILALKATGNYDSSGYVEFMRASVLSSCFDDYSLRQSYSLSYDKGVDRRLLALAKDAGKEILDVESAEAQISMEAEYSEGLQEMLLGQSASYPSMSYIISCQEMFELWCQGDEDALRAYLSDDDSDEEAEQLSEEEQALMDEYTKAMETDRNAGMLEVAKGYLESDKVVFFAVGLAHLLAEDGLVNTLRDAGYTVELVIYN